MACSATGTALRPGMLATHTASSAATSRSMLSTPTPNCWMRPELPARIAGPGSGDHNGTTTSTGGPPSTKRASSWPWPTTSITVRPARQAGQDCGISSQA